MVGDLSFTNQGFSYFFRKKMANRENLTEIKLNPMKTVGSEFQPLNDR